MAKTPKGMNGMHTITEVRIRPVPNGRDGLVAFASCRPVNGGTGATDVLLSTRPGTIK